MSPSENAPQAPCPQQTRTAAGESASRRHPGPRKSTTGPKGPEQDRGKFACTREPVTPWRDEGVGRLSRQPLAGRKARAPEDGAAADERSAPLTPGNSQLFANK